MYFITKKNIAVCIILTFVTCGIYSIYWLYKMAEGVNAVKQDPNATSPGMVIVWSILTCGIYELFWLYKAGETIDSACMMQGRPAGNKAILYLLLSIFGLAIVTYGLLQNDLNEQADFGQGGDRFGGYGGYGGYGNPYGNQGGYGNPYGSPGGYGDQGGYGNPGGYGSQGGYGGPGGYGGQGSYGNPYGNQGGYGAPGGYGGQGGSYGQSDPYGAGNVNGPSDPYGSGPANNSGQDQFGGYIRQDGGSGSSPYSSGGWDDYQNPQGGQ